MLRHVEQLLPELRRHARQADFGQLQPDELRLLRDGRDEVRGLLIG